MKTRRGNSVAKCDDYHSARVRYVSCLMPEASGFQVDLLPPLPADQGVLRILVVAGNLSHFAGDLDMVLWKHWAKEYEIMVFVPGPYDYGSGTTRTGDTYCDALCEEIPSLTVLNAHSSGCCDSLYLTGPNLRITGALCWPPVLGLYKESRVFEPGTNETEDIHNVSEKQYLLRDTAQARLDADLAHLLVQAELAKAADQKLMVVTYGCPSPAMCSTVRSDHPFRGYFSASKSFYTFMLSCTRWWVYGARGNKGIDKFIGDNGFCVTLHNHFDASKPDRLVHAEERDGTAARKSVITVSRK